MKKQRTAARLCAALMAGSALSAGAAHAERVALVIGNSHYPTQDALPNAHNDATGMAGALRGLGFKVIELEDGSKASMRAALEQFSSTLHKDDVALFYYAGHGLQGPALRAEDGLDNYLLPVDGQPDSADRLPGETVALSDVLNRIDRAHAGSGLVILDACRENVFTDERKLGRRAAGLSQPTPALMRGVYLAFATAPGSVAEDGPKGADSHGRFTGEILERISLPGQTVSHMFNVVGMAVEEKTNKGQSPWSSSTGSAAELVLVPGPAADVSAVELDAYREGIKCESQACFSNALSRIDRPLWRADLRQLAQRLADKEPPIPMAAPSRAKPMKTPAPVASGLLPSATAFIAANAGTADGRLRVAHAYAAGSDGLPHSTLEAFRWTQSAASEGDVTATYELAIVYRDGLGTPKNRRQALKLLLQAAQGGSVNGMYEVSRIYSHDAKDMPHDYEQALKWLHAAVEAGDSRAMYQLAAFYGSGMGVKQDYKEGYRWLKLSADKGNVDALYGIGSCYNSDICGLPPEPPRAIAYYQQAADKGSALGWLAIGTCYDRGHCGLAKDPAQAFSYYKKAADLGNVQALTFIGAHYDQGEAPVAADPTQAISYFRKAAERGEPLAMMFLGIHYDFGSGVPRNLGAARFWYQQAADAGDETGRKAIAGLDAQEKQEQHKLTPAEAKKLTDCAAQWRASDRKQGIMDYLKACTGEGAAPGAKPAASSASPA